MKVPESRCPNCNKALNAASDLRTSTRPEPGDFSVCLHCGHLVAFTAELGLRALTEAEMIEIAGDPEVLLAMKVVGEFKKFKKENGQ